MTDLRTVSLALKNDTIVHKGMYSHHRFERSEKQVSSSSVFKRLTISIIVTALH